MMAEPPSTPSRHEKSLGLLTIKFVNLLQEAQDGVLDLKVVSVVAFYTPLEVCMCNRQTVGRTAGYSIEP